jgi:hypothetical protein
LSWAKAAGYRTGDNPVEGVAKGLPKQRDRNEHHAAMPFADIPAFVERMRGDTGHGEITRLALEFLILTATRTCSRSPAFPEPRGQTPTARPRLLAHARTATLSAARRTSLAGSPPAPLRNGC